MSSGEKEARKAALDLGKASYIMSAAGVFIALVAIIIVLILVSHRSQICPAKVISGFRFSLL